VIFLAFPNIQTTPIHLSISIYNDSSLYRQNSSVQIHYHQHNFSVNKTRCFHNHKSHIKMQNVKLCWKPKPLSIILSLAHVFPAHWNVILCLSKCLRNKGKTSTKIKFFLKDLSLCGFWWVWMFLWLTCGIWWNFTERIFNGIFFGEF